MTKRCPKCEQTLPAEAFSKSRKSLGPYCKPCQKLYCREHYQRNAKLHNRRRLLNQARYRKRNREWMVAYLKEHPCVDCGESDLMVLDFDHIHSKKDNISELVGRGFSWQRIEKEIAKCVVRCANCHRRKTAVDRGWYKSLGIGA